MWAALCACWPKNLRIIIRYLFIVSGMAPNELIGYVSLFNNSCNWMETAMMMVYVHEANYFFHPFLQKGEKFFLTNV